MELREYRTVPDAGNPLLLVVAVLLPDAMTITTKVTLRSGDRAALDGVVEDIRETAHRKGVDLRGPHSEAPAELRVPLYANVDGDRARQFPGWRYTVYSRRLELVGHEESAQFLLTREFPDSVHVEVELDRIRPVGSA